MSSFPQASSKSDFEALRQMALDRSEKGRSALARTIADIGLAEHEGLTEREVQLAFDILHRLVRDVEMRVRRDLAQRLAAREDVPRELVVSLANDDIAVAYPILVGSVVLEDDDLIAIARTGSASHQRAMTLRDHVGAAVSAALVATRNIEVIDSLLRNPAAELSEPTMQDLVDMSRDTPPLQRPLLQRADLPSDLAWRMYEWVGDALKDFIADKHPEGVDELDAEIRAAVRDALAAERAAAKRDLAALVSTTERRGGISAEALIQTLRKQDVELFEALFARLTRLNPVTMPMIVYDPGGEAFAIACKACSFTEHEYEQLCRLLAKSLSPGTGTDLREHHAILARYGKLDSGTARRILAGWRQMPAAAWQTSP